VLQTAVEGIHELIEAGGAPGEPGGAGGVIGRGLAVVFAAVEFDRVIVVAAGSGRGNGRDRTGGRGRCISDDLGHEFEEEVLDVGVGAMRK
jgi:hypothetical protein